jgi:hypothetical protein
MIERLVFRGCFTAWVISWAGLATLILVGLFYWKVLLAGAAVLAAAFAVRRLVKRRATLRP